MDSLGTKIGFWASLIQSFVGYLYGIIYVVFVIVFPPEPWTSIEEFVSQYQGSYLVMLTVIQLLAFMQSFLFLLVAVVINNYVSERRKIVANIGLYSSVIFLTLSGITYYIQWTCVRESINSGMIEGLGQVIQINFNSPISAINILGWTFFFGISNLCFAFCFNKTTRGRWLQWGFLINGIMCIVTSLLFACGVKSVMLIWTLCLAITWYIYPLLALSFRKCKLDFI